MSERLPLPAELLRSPARAHSIDAQANGVVHRLMDLADRGEYLDAAAQAAELLRGPASDVRLVAVYLAGSFVERGATALPDLLACVDRLLSEGPNPHAGPSRLVDSAMAWLFRALADRVAFHTTQRDDTWKAWIHAITPEQIEEIDIRAEMILAKSPGGAGMLHKLARWSRDKLGPAAARLPKPEVVIAEVLSEPPRAPEPVSVRAGWDEPEEEEPEPEPEREREPEEEPEDDDEDDQDDDELDEWDPPAGFDFDFGSAPGFDPPQNIGSRRALAAPSLPNRAERVEFDSPALAALQAKLRGFEILLERGELDKAAVIASDIQSVIEDFDPILYLPSLFARYLKLLNATLGEIERRWDAGDTTAWRVLVQFYRADLDEFIDD